MPASHGRIRVGRATCSRLESIGRPDRRVARRSGRAQPDRRSRRGARAIGRRAATHGGDSPNAIRPGHDAPRVGWLATVAPSAVDELLLQFQGVYSRMFVTSTAGRLTGTVTCQLTRSPDAARWTLLFNGVSAAATSVNGSNAFPDQQPCKHPAPRPGRFSRLDATGLAAEPRSPVSATALVFDQINGGGGRRRQQATNDLVDRPACRPQPSR